MTDKNGNGAPSLGSRLRRRQISLKLKQYEAAELCGVTQSVYSRWLAELTMPSMANLPGVAEFLGVSRDALLVMMPESYQMKQPNIDVDALRSELHDLRMKQSTTTRQLSELRRVVDALTAIVEQFTPTV